MTFEKYVDCLCTMCREAISDIFLEAFQAPEVTHLYTVWEYDGASIPPWFCRNLRSYIYAALSIACISIFGQKACRKVTEFSSLQILQSGCNPRHLNSRAFLDCSGLHLDYMDYKVIKWIAEQYNPKQSKGNLCNPSAIHCNLGLQFCFAIQINLCNLTAIQEDCKRIAEIAEIANILQLKYTVGHPTACRGGCVRTASRQRD